MTADLRLVALRCLRDCGVVRCGPGRVEYGGLVSEGVADVRRVLAGDRYVYDYSLSLYGRKLAAVELRS